MDGINQLNVGDKVPVNKLKTFQGGFAFEFIVKLAENKIMTYERTQLRVQGMCNVKEGDTVQINNIRGHGWAKYRSYQGYIKYPFLIVDITNLTPPKIEW